MVLVLIKFSLGDDSIVVPKVGQNLEAGDIAVANLLVLDLLEIDVWDSLNEHVAQCFVSITVGPECGLGNEMFPVTFSDLGSCWGRTFMDRIHGRIDRDEEGTACSFLVLIWSLSQGKMAMLTTATIGGDRVGVAVQFVLGDADGGMVGANGGSGNGS